MHCAAPGGLRPAPVTYHVRQLDVGKAVDQRLAEVGELMQERLILLLDHLVLLLDGLEAGLHGGDLQRTDRATCNRSRPQREASAAHAGAQPLRSDPEVSGEGLDAEGVTLCALSPHTEHVASGR